MDDMSKENLLSLVRRSWLDEQEELVESDLTTDVVPGEKEITCSCLSTVLCVHTEGTPESSQSVPRCGGL